MGGEGVPAGAGGDPCAKTPPSGAQGAGAVAGRGSEGHARTSCCWSREASRRRSGAQREPQTGKEEAPHSRAGAADASHAWPPRERCRERPLRAPRSVPVCPHEVPLPPGPGVPALTARAPSPQTRARGSAVTSATSALSHRGAVRQRANLPGWGRKPRRADPAPNATGAMAEPRLDLKVSWKSLPGASEMTWMSPRACEWPGSPARSPRSGRDAPALS